MSGGSDVDSRKMRHWGSKLQERPRGDVLECGIRWAVEARRKERGEQQEQWRQGGQGEQPAETRGGEWIWQGEEETGGEDEHRERKGNGRHGQGEETIESENDTSKEDCGKFVGAKNGLSGFGQDHCDGEMGSWYQDQWWGSGTWGEESEAKGFGSMEKRWRGSRERSFRVVAGAHSRAKEGTVAVKMKIGGGGLGEEKEEDQRRR